MGKKKKKNNITHTQRQVIGFWEEIERITKEQSESKRKLSAKDIIDPPWLAECSENIQEDYQAWKERGVQKYGSHFIGAIQLFLGKEFRNTGSWEWLAQPYLEITTSAFMEKLCERLDEDFDRYKDRILEAAQKDNEKKDEICLSSIMPVGTNPTRESKNFHYTIPSFAVEFLYTHQRASGLPKTNNTTSKLLIDEVMDEKETRQKQAKTLLCLYVYLVWEYCRDLFRRKSEVLKECERSVARTMFSEAEKKSLIQKMANQHNVEYATVSSFINQDQSSTERKIADFASHFENNSNLFYILGAATYFGVSRKSLLWIYLLKFFGAQMFAELDLNLYDADGVYINESILLSISCVKSKVNCENARKAAEYQQTLAEAEQARKKASTIAATADKKVAEAQKKAQAALREAKALREENERLAAELVAKNNDIELLRITCKSLEEMLPPEPENPEDDAEDSGEAGLAYPIRSSKKIVIYGGHATWVSPMRQRFPDCTFQFARGNYNYSPASSADVIVIQTNAISHSSYGSVKAIAERNGIPVRYFEKAGVESCTKQLYGILEEFDAIV